MAVVLRPTASQVETVSKLDLEAMFPREFDTWVVDDSIVPLLPTPELQAVIDKTYDQTLSRTYRNASGERVMLSVAYGGTHGEAMQTHRPEICYPAQGFRIVEDTRPAILSTSHGRLDVNRLVAAQRQRVEPITYWVVVGGEQARFGLAMKLAQLKAGLTGGIPDGMLVRVSTLDHNMPDAFRVHDAFINGLLSVLQPTHLQRVLGGVAAAER